MLDRFEFNNYLDENENPAGGYVRGVGLAIDWQQGPLGTGDERRAPNGAFVETVTQAAIERIEFYQRSKFACDENKLALKHLKLAVEAMQSRTKSRESRGVEGTHAK